MKMAPIEIFGSIGTTAKAFISAHRYIQGPGILTDLGTYLPMVGSKRPGLLLPRDLPVSIGETVREALSVDGLSWTESAFGGQCSIEEIDAQVAIFRASERDAVVAVGGGKAIDTAKCVARRLDVSLVICPTLASTDAPCSAASVIYTAEGAFKDVEFIPSNPDLVIVDTSFIVRAPVRFLVAGMADALATGYEARTCVSNPSARSMVGGRITIAAATIAEICSKTIFEHADGALQAAREGVSNDSFEAVVEANTLLSGTGFESAGLAAAHAVASALTLIPSVEHGFLHGEMVAVGTMVHLQLEERLDDLARVEELLTRLGLPVSFSDLGISMEAGDETLETVLNAACAMPFMANEPMPVTTESLRKAVEAVELRKIVTTR
jgi:glycerol dehydrogenase